MTRSVVHLPRRVELVLLKGRENVPRFLLHQPVQFCSIDMSPLVPLNPASPATSHRFSIGKSVDGRRYNGWFGQPQVCPPDESKIVSGVMTEIDGPQVEFIHVRGGRPVTGYSPPVHDYV